MKREKITKPRGIQTAAAFIAIVCLTGVQAFQITNAELENKIKGAWLAKTAGVIVGEPTEFNALGRMYTDPINLYPDLTHGFNQDDLYVQVTFIKVMDGWLDEPNTIFGAKMVDYGWGFSVTGYQLWWANETGRDNVRNGIDPPYSGMWAGPGNQYNERSDAIDWQIEADWVGIMTPAMPMTAVRLSDSVGHVMNYGDGLYGGHWIAAMEALAFKYTESTAANVRGILLGALNTIPKDSEYYKMVMDVIAYYDGHPGSVWQECWNYINTKYLHYISSPCILGDFNILASFNGAFIAIGLMYGEGNIFNTIEYSLRCGQDSDCNPGNAATVLGIIMGYDALPAEWKSSINSAPNQTYASSDYTWSDLLTSSITRAGKAIVQMGGSRDGDTWTIPEEEPAQPLMVEAYGAEPVINPYYVVPVTKKTVSPQHAGNEMMIVRSGSGYHIRLNLPVIGLRGKAVLTLSDIQGRTVREFELSQFSYETQVAWDGTDMRGARAASGIYYLRFESSNTQISREVMVP